MNQFKIIDRPLNGGTQKIYRFNNSYGASVIKHQYSYGGLNGKSELAVIKFDGDGEWDWNLCYDTEITNDVLGHLGDDEVTETLRDIKALK